MEGRTVHNVIDPLTGECGVWCSPEAWSWLLTRSTWGLTETVPKGDPGDRAESMAIAVRMSDSWLDWIMPQIAERVRKCPSEADLESLECDCMTYIRSIISAAIERGVGHAFAVSSRDDDLEQIVKKTIWLCGLSGKGPTIESIVTKVRHAQLRGWERQECTSKGKEGT